MKHLPIISTPRRLTIEQAKRIAATWQLRSYLPSDPNPFPRLRLWRWWP